MRNIKLVLAYDGTEYHGWQIQPDRPTVQGVVSSILSRITQEQVSLEGAGRTDAGVHAWGQVASFHTPSDLRPREFAHALNALLPPAIRVRSAEEVPAEFHARWSAEAKTYWYTIDRRQIVSPFHFRYALHHPHPLDFDAMGEAARCFEGEHDFTTFAASSGCEEEDRDRNILRAIYRSELLAGLPAGQNREPGAFGAPSLPGSDEWIYAVRGKSFLRHMVRRIVGTLLEVGRGRLRPGDIPSLFELRDRSRSGPTAPAHGLCLVSVEYPGAPAVPPDRQESEGLQ